jgi:multidrug efflux pump subunit AcrA (membrane-fusion protein)
MKKILIAFVASIALVLGSGAALSGASAAYPSTVPVQTPSVPTKTVGEGDNFKVTIKIKAGNSKVNGTLTVKFNGKTYKVKVKNGVAKFKGKAPKVSGTKTKAIKYTFKPAKGSVFKSKKGSAKIKIKG